ncbi:MAG: sigma 54-interacting transcriptional regulator [Limisphaerales bacterium]
MNVIAENPPAFRESGVVLTLPRPSLFQTTEMEDGIVGHRRIPEGGSVSPINQILPQLLYELAVRLPALPNVQAFSVWLFKLENYSIRLQLMMAGFPAILRAGLELPLDDAIVNWVWQHQRLLVISTEIEGDFPEFSRRLLDKGIKSFCAVPLVVANRKVGVLGLASTKSEAFQNLKLDYFKFGLTATASLTNDQSRPQKSLKSNVRSSNGTQYLETEISSDDIFEGIVGRSAAMRDLSKGIKVVSTTGSTVLILGETGTGKERVAQAIHNLSPRRERPFIKVNCAAIPAGLIESELFGHERGSFTGAIGRRIGRFEMANGGTLFLDEIGDIPLELQPKLLRVLQEQEFERLGGTQTTRVDVRVVAATSRDLSHMVANKEFRGDLYYRLNVFPLRVAPLRERSEDIALLVRHFVDFHAKRMNKEVKDIPVEIMEVLLRYSWPGNVRELQNIIERAVILSPGKILNPPLDELRQSVQIDVAKKTPGTEITKFEDAAREHIIQALAATNWVVGGPKGAGARLGLTRTTLMGKMRRLGITRAQA